MKRGRRDSDPDNLLSKDNNFTQEVESKNGKLKNIIFSIKASAPCEAIQMLVYIRSKFAFFPIEDRQLSWVLPTLLELLNEVQPETLKIGIIQTVSLLSLFPEADTNLVLSHLLNFSKIDCSANCKKEIYIGLREIFSAKIVQNNFNEHIEEAMRLAWEDIKTSLSTLSNSLNSKNQVTTIPKELPLSAEDIQILLVNYGEDPDPRVRKEAIKALRFLHLRGAIIKPHHYQLCVRGLGDDFEEVRLESIELLWLITASYPEILISVSGVSEKARLIDDAFVNVCNLANDVSARVRTKGFLLLGSFRLVNSSILLQTFSKQKLSRGRNNESSTQNQNKISQITADGEYEMKAEELRLLKASECGAFIHGLEDEFQEVRAASVDSICQLCMHSQEFAIKALDFLVDGFNDEIDTVRMSSITSIAKIGSTYSLTIDEEQLQIILSVLEDKKPSIRAAVHEVLSLLYLDNIRILPLLVNAMIANLLRTPSDLDSIYACLRKVGLHHAKKIDEPIVNSLLNIDKQFLAVEGNKEDITYVAKAVLILNASFAEPSLNSFIPEFMKNHLIYLRHKFPQHLNESLTDSQEITMISKAILEPKSKLDSDKVMVLMSRTVATIQAFDFKAYHDSNDLKTQISQCQKTLDYLASNLAYNSDKAKFLLVLLDSLIIVSELTSKTLCLSEGDFQESPRLLDLAYQMEFRYLGFSEKTISYFIGLRVFASLIYYLNNNFSSRSAISDSEMIGLFLKRIESCLLKSTENDKIKSYLIQVKQQLNSLKIKLDVSDNFSNQEKGLMNSLLKHTLNFPIDIPHLPDTIKEVKAIITKPQTNPQTPREFSPDLPVSFLLECQLSYILDTSSICIEVQYPNLLLHTIWPSQSSFSKISPYRYTLSTKITLLLPAWEEQCSIKAQVVRAFKADVPFIDSATLASARHKIYQESPQDTQSYLTNVLLSAPVEVFFKPK